MLSPLSLIVSISNAIPNRSSILFLILFVNGIIIIADAAPIPNDHIHAVSNEVSLRPSPFAPLYMMKNELMVVTEPISMGNKIVVRL